MKELVTADGMRQIEKHAMEKLQLSDAILMERAALFSAAVLEKELKKRNIGVMNSLISMVKI